MELTKILLIILAVCWTAIVVINNISHLRRTRKFNLKLKTKFDSKLIGLVNRYDWLIDTFKICTDAFLITAVWYATLGTQFEITLILISGGLIFFVLWWYVSYIDHRETMNMFDRIRRDLEWRAFEEKHEINPKRRKTTYRSVLR